MRNKAKIVTLMKVTENSGIYFDFLKNTPYIQHFRSPSFNKEIVYSRSVTFWLSRLLLVGATIIGIIIDKFFVLPVLMSLVIAYSVGIVLGKILIQLMLTNFIDRKEYRKIEKEEILQILSKGKEFWILRLTEIFLYFGLIIVSIILLSQGILKGKDFIMLIVTTFGITLVHDTVYPKRRLKARKILKQQLKAGVFDV